MALCLFVIVFVICSAVSQVGGRVVGSPVSLRADEKHSEYVRKAAQFATGEINKQKLKNGEYDRCTRLKNEIISGTKKVESGIKYSLQLKINPVAIESEECSGVRATPTKWKPELCETEIMWQAWQKPEMELIRSVCLQIED